jgi:hypothetical protein
VIHYLYYSVWTTERLRFGFACLMLYELKMFEIAVMISFDLSTHTTKKQASMSQKMPYHQMESEVKSTKKIDHYIMKLFSMATIVHYQLVSIQGRTSWGVDTSAIPPNATQPYRAGSSNDKLIQFSS